MKSIDTGSGEVSAEKQDHPGSPDSSGRTEIVSDNGATWPATEVTSADDVEDEEILITDLDNVENEQLAASSSESTELVETTTTVSSGGIVRKIASLPEVATVASHSETNAPPAEKLAPVYSFAEYELHNPVPERPWWKPERGQLLAWSPYWAVILLGAILRFWNLGDKPLHHDESLHAYFSLGLLHNLQNYAWCFGLNNAPAGYSCYKYDPLLHGPFQFHAIALVYQLSSWLGAPDNGVNTTTVRIAAALLGTLIVGLPFFLRDYIGRVGAWLACLLLAVSPSMVYFSRFAREDIYMACFTLCCWLCLSRAICGHVKCAG